MFDPFGVPDFFGIRSVGGAHGYSMPRLRREE
jgi:hypothetical protein